jgi:hypothetical protein
MVTLLLLYLSAATGANLFCRRVELIPYNFQKAQLTTVTFFEKKRDIFLFIYSPPVHVITAVRPTESNERSREERKKEREELLLFR